MVLNQKSGRKAENIIKNLMTTQFESDKSKQFELVLRDAFEFLGFDATHIGGSSDTDVLIVANIGKESFRAIVDGKTTKGGEKGSVKT